MKQEKKISVALVIALIALAVTFKCIELKYSDLPIGLSIKEKLLFAGVSLLISTVFSA